MSEPITSELREYVRLVRAFHLNDIHGKKREYVEATTTDILELADRIDQEHERRMADSIRHAVDQTLSGGKCNRVFDEDYIVGINGYCESYRCSECGKPLFKSFNYCPWCGKEIVE